ncbi:MAG: hypothetical protein Q4G04_00675 [bacterium]|nr:hypothetical protein [bacterium]
MENDLIKLVDEACLPTISKYVDEQLVSAIVKYIECGSTTSFTNDYNSREKIEKIGIINFERVLLEHVVKLDALYDIKKFRLLTSYSKDYENNSVGESELRLFELLSLSVDDVFNITAVEDAIKLLESDEVLLYNIVKSFVDFRYVKVKQVELDKSYINSDLHKRIMWNIQEYFNSVGLS